MCYRLLPRQTQSETLAIAVVRAAFCHYNTLSMSTTLTRRQFLYTSAEAGIALSATGKALAHATPAPERKFYSSLSLGRLGFFMRLFPNPWNSPQSMASKGSSPTLAIWRRSTTPISIIFSKICKKEI